MKRRFIAAIMGRIIACVLLLVLGYGVMSVLSSMREPPVQAVIRERALRVDVLPVHFEDDEVRIKGFGQARARDVVSIAPEIPGRIVSIHPDLEVGEVIPAGEVLFKVDPRDYQAGYDAAKASQDVWENAIRRLEKQHSIDRDRYKTLERSRELAVSEFDRVKRLYEEDQVGTQSLADQAEMGMNQATDAADQLAQVVDLYPIRIQEARSNLATMNAHADLAAANLDRTTIVVPFDARVKSVSLEVGQYVSLGQAVLTLADDSVLEIAVPLDSREARDWLRFEEPAHGGKGHNGAQIRQKAWFRQVVRTKVRVFWTEGSEASSWPGVLHRIAKFDQETRTVTVIVRVEGSDAAAFGDRALPLVDGMFCRVEIPGRIAKNVVRLPAESVGFDREATGFRTVYVAEKSPDSTLRLKTVKVAESHVDGEYVFLASGLDEGDLVITTRLVNPIENSLLEVQIEDAVEQPS